MSVVSPTERMKGAANQRVAAIEQGLQEVEVNE